jgi:AbrB family looped-hinge helix DNA binding protein
MDAKGGVTIPADYLKALGLKPGDKVILIIENGELIVRKVDQAVKRVQPPARNYVPEGGNLLDESVEERREMDCE